MAVNKASKKAKKINFKYVAKIGKGKDTRYFYSNAEYLAYLRAAKLVNKPVKPVKPVTTTTTKIKLPDHTKIVDEGRKLADRIAKKLEDNRKNDAIAKFAERGRRKIEAFLKNAAKHVEFAKRGIELSAKLAVEFANKKTSEEDTPSTAPGWAKDLAVKESSLTHDEDQALVNPDYDPYDEAYSMNCSNCTAAYDLRRRGYDVEAAPYDPSSPNAQSDIRDIAGWYENTTVYDWKLSKPDQAEDVFYDMPDGSYGHLGILWSTGGGHNVVWERNNGETVIRDCQNNRTYTYAEWVDTYDGFVNDVAILRTDDREPSEQIRNSVRNRKERS